MTALNVKLIPIPIWAFELSLYGQVNMKVTALEIPDVKLLTLPKFGDERGFFSEVYNKKELTAQGIEIGFVQDNQAYSANSGTLRGLHFQAPPHAQDKLIRVISGSIFDVAVDIRCGSPTFGKHASAVISAKAWNQMLVPVGFAHGYCTLEPDTEILYKVSDYYAPDHDLGVLWSDPALNIAWPVAQGEAVISEKDRGLPLLATIESPFDYHG